MNTGKNSESAPVDAVVIPHIPDREGVWRLTDRNGEVFEDEVYRLPNGTLCVWGSDFGQVGICTTEVWETDEWLGHIPVSCLGGYWEFVSG